ncbi:MAG: flagellar basal body rod protein FlgC [Verrucomicrobiales bacterium]|nr:flagellar basal body rod protein FlgC [Verrucomicrobiales bacterium]
MPPLIPGVTSTTAALTAERTRLDVIAQNVANANTTRSLDGLPYRRQQVAFETILDAARTTAGGDVQLGGPRVSKIRPDPRPFPSIHEPGHPDAHPVTGQLLLPNVSVHEEMADMIAASRTFDANLAVFRTARQMTMQALTLGKR